VTRALRGAEGQGGWTAEAAGAAARLYGRFLEAVGKARAAAGHSAQAGLIERHMARLQGRAAQAAGDWARARESWAAEAAAAAAAGDGRSGARACVALAEESSRREAWADAAAWLQRAADAGLPQRRGRGVPGGDADADWPSGGEGASAADLVGPALERLSAQAHHRAARGLLRRAAGLMADGDHEARPARAARRPLEPFRRRDARALALPRRPRRAPPFPPPPCPHAALPSFT
jgi:hypothetical protein